MPNVKKGGTTLCRTPFPTSVFPCQIASLQGGTTLCRTPPFIGSVERGKGRSETLVLSPMAMPAFPCYTIYAVKEDIFHADKRRPAGHC